MFILMSLSTMLNYRSSASSGEEGLSDQVDQVFELTRVIVLVLTGLLPKLADAKSLGMLLSPSACTMSCRY